MLMRPMALVRFTDETKQRILANLAPVYRPYFGENGEGIESAWVFFGEIPNMPGHGVFMGHTSHTFLFGWHIEDFEEIPEDET